MNKYDYKNICPFKWFVLENFPFIEDDFDALTNWQLFCKIGKEINKIIASQNEVGKAVEEFTEKFIALYNYVHDYFDNLDVQEEINNKLDEMVADGSLEQVIAAYIDNTMQRTYDTNSDLISDTSLTSGMNVKTLGKLSKNDGMGCYYYISDTAPESLPVETNNESLDNFYLTLSNGKYAIPTNNINNDYYDEITVVKERHNDTDCYFSTIPLLDNDEKQIDLYVKNNSTMEISDYARLHKTTLSINATLTVENPDTNLYENCSVISDGQIIRDHLNPPDFLDNHYKFIGIKSDRTFVDFQANITTAEQMIAQGVKQAWLCFGQLVNNGVITDYAQDTTDDIMANFYPRQAIGVKLDKTVVILTCDGRTMQDRGLTGVETAQLLIEKGCVNVWNLDGGGSTNTLYKGCRVNKFIDEHGTKERHIVYCLNAKKPTTNKNIDDVNSYIGKVKDDIIKQLIPTIPKMLMKNPANLNELTTGTNLYSCYNCTNQPAGQPNYGYLLVIPIASTDNVLFGKYCKQFFINRLNNRIWIRTLNNEVWTNWTECNIINDCEITSVANQSMGIGSNYIVLNLNNSVSNYMPTKIFIDENKIKSSVNGGCLVNAQFTIEIGLDGICTIRLRKNGTDNIGFATFTGVAGQRYNIHLQKMVSLSDDDYLEITSNGGTNTGGVNKIISANINILQNIH